MRGFDAHPAAAWDWAWITGDPEVTAPLSCLPTIQELSRVCAQIEALESRRQVRPLLRIARLPGTGPILLVKRVRRRRRTGKDSTLRATPSADRAEPTCAPARNRQASPPLPAAMVRRVAGADHSDKPSPRGQK